MVAQGTMAPFWKFNNDQVEFYTRMDMAYQIFDSPATTSAVTYKIQGLIFKVMCYV